MVTRKSSLGFPPSPPPAPPQVDPWLSASNELMVDSSDLPPIPKTQRDAHASRTAHSYLEGENPWSDHQPSQLRSDRPLPDFLKPRDGKPVDVPVQNSLQDIHSALKTQHTGADTPRSSIDSGESRGFWEDDEVPDSPSKKTAQEEVDNGWTHVEPCQPPAPTELPPPPPEVIKRKPVAAVPAAPTKDSPLEPPQPAFASNNPFRRPSSQESQQSTHSQDMPNLPHWGDEPLQAVDKGKSVLRVHGQQSPPLEAMGRLSLVSQMTEEQPREDPWRPLEPSHRPPPPQAAPPPIPQPLSSPLSEQPPLIPVTSRDAPPSQVVDPWASAPELVPSPSAEKGRRPAWSSGIRIDQGQEAGVVPVNIKAKPSISTSNVHAARSEPSLLDDFDDVGPPLPARPQQSDLEDGEMYAPPPGPPPTQPPRPSIKTTHMTDAQLAKSLQDRSETYQIKHFNWFDHGSGKLRTSSMLTQNENGPCPLLALVNALILGTRDESQASLDDALRSREQVSLGLIIETLMYELVSRGAETGTELPDVDELNAFLLRLKTGMNANPRFVTASTPPPNIMDARNSMLHLPQARRQQEQTGTFENTLDMKLYGTFSVPLLHGWLPEPRSDAESAFRRSAQTYEDAQAIQFGEEELEYKLSRGGLSSEEQKVWEDINAIKNFFKLYPTQLTPYGLESVQEALPSGSFAIIFRNDHFSTIFKHPDSGQLFTLITDAGYADRDEIIWESLVDISGANNEYFSGDFMPVSHDTAHSRHDSRANNSLNHQQHLSVNDITDQPLSPQEQQEQHDADFAMALQLQEEEEQRQRAETARRRSGGQSGGSGSGGGGGRRQSPRRGGRGGGGGGSNSNIPISLRPVQSRSDAPENRPTIPPRGNRVGERPAVNRPADSADDDAPPAYEEAAKGKPYIPPVGSPLHPTYSQEPGQSASSSNVQLTGTASNISNLNLSNTGSVHPPGPNAPFITPAGPSGGRGGRAGMAGRRMSAYRENAYRSPGGYLSAPGQDAMGQGQGGVGMPGEYVSSGRHGRNRGDDRECRVM